MALKPTRSITGAMVRVLAVSIPSAAHRLWLPSRREVSTICMLGMFQIMLRSHAHQDLPIFDRGTILNQYLDHFAFHARVDGIHELHHFDDTDHRVLVHFGAYFYEWRLAGLVRAIKDSQK